jgi:WD40-like Beta Propeller Repeat
MGRLRVALLATVALCLTLFTATAEGAFPGTNGKILFVTKEPGDSYRSAHTINPDGTGVARLPGFHETPTWSPSGTRIAYDCGAILCGMNANGSYPEFWYDHGWAFGALDWAPDESELHFIDVPVDYSESPTIWHVDAHAGAGAIPINSEVQPGTLARAPDGSKVAFMDGWTVPVGGIQMANPNGSDIATVPNTTAVAQPRGLDWSPDAQRLVFSGEQSGVRGLFTIKRDGSDLRRLTTDPDGYFDITPAWAPDGSKIAFIRRQGFQSPTELMVVGVGGGSPTALPAAGTAAYDPDWQPIPINTYPRPKGASPTRVSLVPAYARCTSGNRAHGPPLGFPSCNPPTRVPGQLTIGTFDANGQPAKSVSYIRINPIRGNPATPADEADVRMRGTINDVRLASDLSDYTGDVAARLSIRITDRDNTPSPGGPGAATVQDFTHSQPLPCAATADTTVGSSCDFDTTVEALVPGAVKEQQRAIWALDAVRVHDGAGNLFLTQGIFVP